MNNYQTNALLGHNPSNLRIVKLLCYLLLGVTLLFIWSCSSSTSNEVGSLSGQIELVNDTGDPLLDPTDFSGVTVALYPLAVLDTTVVRVNNKYPNIGVQISQETEFDHRKAQPLKTVTTDMDGSFRMDDIPTGRYNVVVLKSGWGYKYFNDFNINQGDNYLDETTSREVYSLKPDNFRTAIRLYPEKELFGTILGNYRFERDRCFLINDNLSISGNLVIENGSRVNFANNKSLMVTGDLSSEDNGNGEFSLISSVSAIDEQSNGYNEIQVFGDVDLKKCIVENSTNGLRVNNSSSVVTDCIVRNSTAGITFNQCASAVVDRCIAVNIRENIDGLFTSYAGFYAIGCQSVSVKNSIVVNNSSGVKVKDLCYGQVTNCYFSRNRYASESYSSETRIHHNVFDSSEMYDVRVCGHQLVPTVDYNLIASKSGIIVGLDLNDNYVACKPIINNNNLLASELALYVIGFNAGYIDATYNYFNTTDTQIIDGLIIDRNDLQAGNANLVYAWTGYFDYSHFRSSKVVNAGIQ